MPPNNRCRRRHRCRMFTQTRPSLVRRRARWPHEAARPPCPPKWCSRPMASSNTSAPPSTPICCSVSPMPPPAASGASSACPTSKPTSSSTARPTAVAKRSSSSKRKRCGTTVKSRRHRRHRQRPCAIVHRAPSHHRRAPAAPPPRDNMHCNRRKGTEPSATEKYSSTLSTVAFDNRVHLRAHSFIVRGHSPQSPSITVFISGRTPSSSSCRPIDTHIYLRTQHLRTGHRSLPRRGDLRGGSVSHRAVDRHHDGPHVIGTSRGRRLTLTDRGPASTAECEWKR